MPPTEKTFTELVDDLERARVAWVASNPGCTLRPMTWDRAIAASLDSKTPLTLPAEELANIRIALVDRTANERMARDRQTRIPWKPGTKVWLVTGSPAHTVVDDSRDEVKAITWGQERALPLSLPIECWTDVEPTATPANEPLRFVGGASGVARVEPTTPDVDLRECVRALLLLALTPDQTREALIRGDGDEDRYLAVTQSEIAALWKLVGSTTTHG